MSPVDAASGTYTSQAAVAVAAKQLENTKLEGEMANKLIQLASQPAQGAPPPSDGTRGTLVNTYA